MTLNLVALQRNSRLGEREAEGRIRRSILYSKRRSLHLLQRSRVTRRPFLVRGPLKINSLPPPRRIPPLLLVILVFTMPLTRENPRRLHLPYHPFSTPLSARMSRLEQHKSQNQNLSRPCSLKYLQRKQLTCTHKLTWIRKEPRGNTQDRVET